MKKLFTLILFVSLAGFVNAQSFTANNITANVYGTTEDSTLQAFMEVINTSSNDLSVLLQRYDLSVVPGSENSFCWGIICYGSSTYLSPLENILTPGVTDVSFRGDYYPHGYPGNTTVAYTIFDMNNANDSLQVVITYSALATGVNEIKNDVSTLSVLSPNPANTLTGFSYAVSDKSTSVIRISDVLGKTVQTLPLKANKGNIIIPVSEMRSGVYFVSLDVNKETVVTKKLVVNHH